MATRASDTTRMIESDRRSSAGRAAAARRQAGPAFRHGAVARTRRAVLLPQRQPAARQPGHLRALPLAEVDGLASHLHADQARLPALREGVGQVSTRHRDAGARQRRARTLRSARSGAAADAGTGGCDRHVGGARRASATRAWCASKSARATRCCRSTWKSACACRWRPPRSVARYLAVCGDTERADLLDQLKELDHVAWPALKQGIDKSLAMYQELGVCSSFGEWQPDVNGIAVGFRPGNGLPPMAINCGAPAFKVSSELSVERRAAEADRAGAPDRRRAGTARAGVAAVR